MSSTERKMAAIVAMDVTSYSEKMGRDEEGTLKHLRACREIIETVVAENRGRIFNTAGDAFMIEFSSAVSALSAAVEIQKLIKNRNDSLVFPQFSRHSIMSKLDWSGRNEENKIYV